MTGSTYTDGRASTARRALVAIVTMFFVLAALQGIAMLRGGSAFPAFAQTGTPAPPTIKFINPDTETSTVVADHAYHLTTFVNSLPAGATAEFQIWSQDSNGDPANKEATIPATLIADSFHGTWTPNVSDDTYTAFAILFSNGNEVSRDTEEITVNREDNPIPPDPLPDPEDAAAWVDITAPANGGTWGVFTRENGSKVGVIDYVASDDTRLIQGFYTTSAPGTDPAWTSCGSRSAVEDQNGTTAEKPGDLRCTVASADDPAKVTGVAIVPNNSPANTPDPVVPEFNGAADGHRVFGYRQTMGGVTVTPATRQVPGTNSCTDFTALLTDQFAKPIAGGNVDVHAAGPDDNLQFDTGGDFSDRNQPPDKGHTFDQTAADCAADGTTQADAGSQGFHDKPNAPDVKHVESLASTDTNDDGLFKFALTSETAGTTQITAWGDADFDDLHCGTEPSDTASIGWGGTAAPTPSGVPADTATCTATSGSPSGSPSRSTSASPSPSRSASPSPSTSSPSQAQRTVTLTASRGRVPAGATVKLSGSVLSTNTTCQDNETVRIDRRIFGTSTFQEFDTTSTDANGQFSVSVLVGRSAEYIAVAPAHDNCAEAQSESRTVLAKVRVFLPEDLGKRERVDRDKNFRLQAAVRPQHDGSKVVLQRKKGKRWVKVQTEKLNRKSIATFIIEVNWRGDRRFRVVWPGGQHDDHEKGTSRAVTLIARN